MIRRFGPLALAVVCALALASCGGGNGSSLFPDSVSGAGRQGQINFVKYWIDTFNHAMVTGDTAKLKKLSAKSCAACKGFAHSVDAIYNSGGHVNTKGGTVTHAIPVAGTPKDEPKIRMDVKFAKQVVYKSKNAKPKVYPTASRQMQMVLTRKDQHWLLLRIDIGPPG